MCSVRLTVMYLRNCFVPLEINEAICSQVGTKQQNTFLEADEISSLSNSVYTV